MKTVYSIVAYFSLAVFLLSGCGNVPKDPPIVRLEAAYIPICYNYGCAVKDSFSLSQENVTALSKLFQGKSPKEERESIRTAIKWMEIYAGQQTPTHVDRGQNPWLEIMPGGMDCIDESINSTTYMSFFERQGWLRFHSIEQRVYRAAFLYDLHHAAQIKDLKTGEFWVVDSWHLDNGNKPYIQPKEDWFYSRAFVKEE